jgi:hypothetical protein
MGACGSCRYEMIACTFLLSLVKDGNDSSTTLFTSLQKTVGKNPSSETIKDIVDKLQAKGSQEQLIMFLTGPAGSGKSTDARVAEQFCYEFVLLLVSCGVIQHSCLLHTLELLRH